MTTTETPPTDQLKGWWKRENQRRQTHLLILLSIVILLIAYFYYISASGRTGIVNGISFNTKGMITFIKEDSTGNTRLDCIRSDGSHLTPLTLSGDTSDKENPAWTVHGHHVVYISNLHNASTAQIFVLGTGDPVQLTYGNFRKDYPVCSSDGKHVAFITQGFVKTVYLNGNNVRQILPLPIAGNSPGVGASAFTLDPKGPYVKIAYGPDGVALAGTQQLSSQDNMDMPGLAGDEEAIRALTANASSAATLDIGRFTDFSWSDTPDQVKNSNVLMTSYAERLVTDPITHKDIYTGGIDIWNLNQSHPQPKPLVIMEGYTIMPHHIAWSPNGKQIAFDAYKLNKDGSRTPLGIYIVRTPNAPTVITQKETIPPAMIPASALAIPERPIWSPDGSQLLYEVRRPSGKHDIWVVNSDMTDAVNLTQGAKDHSDNIDPAWSPAH